MVILQYGRSLSAKLVEQIREVQRSSHSCATSSRMAGSRRDLVERMKEMRCSSFTSGSTRTRMKVKSSSVVITETFSVTV